VRPDQLERRLQERLEAIDPAPRVELLHVLMLPDFDRRPNRAGRLDRADKEIAEALDAPHGAARMRHAEGSAPRPAGPHRS
jgi:hypothetical protein